MNNKTNHRRIATLLIVVFTLSLLPYEVSTAASYKLNKKSITLRKGTTYTLRVKKKPKKVKWTSANRRVATVTSKGKILAKRTGSTKITAKIKKKKLICKVKVIAAKKTATKQPVATQIPTATAVPSATPAPTQTLSDTEQEVYNTIIAFQTSFPEGMALDNSYYYKSPVFGNGYGCYGFAAKLSDAAFGTKKAYTKHSDFSKIKVGDHIRLSGPHSVIVLSKSDTYVTVVEGNYGGKVHWGRKLTSSTLKERNFFVYTRY